MSALSEPPVRPPVRVGDVLLSALERDPGHEAVVATDGRLSYGSLDRAADNAASALHEEGVRRGDVVGVSLPNTTHLVVLFHAILRLGALFLGVNQNLAAPEKLFILEDAGAAILLGDPHTVDALSRLRSGRVLAASEDGGFPWTSSDRHDDHSYPRPLCNPDDAAGIAYTSGTTGRPKGVVHTHRNLLLPGAVLNACRGYGPALRKGDSTALTILNLQIANTLLVAQAGGTQVIIDRVDPTGIAAWIRRERVTCWFGVPTQLFGLAHAADVDVQDLSTLRDVWTGGAQIPPAVRSAFEERFGKPVHATYGLTEVPTIVTIEPLDQPHVPGSSGVPLPHLQIEITDDVGNPVAPGEIGDITVRAQRQGRWAGLYRPMLGYHGQADATQAAIRDGALVTGDVGEVDKDGHLYVRGRRNSLILRGGANIYPAEVERVLSEVDGVAGAAVVGLQDERLGQRVAAAVEAKPGAALSVAVLESHCRANLARYKTPVEWYIGTLPRNAMGKVNEADVTRLFRSADDE